MNNDYFTNYTEVFLKNINDLSKAEKSLKILEKKILKIKKSKRTIFFFGNGGSASIASHCAIDYAKNSNIKTQAFTNGEMITCLANDYGHSNWMKEACKVFIEKNDLVIFISSSGNSMNHVNAARYCKKNKIYSFSLTGFNKNKLSKITDLNYIVSSKNYNQIENVHSFYLLMLIDKISSKKII